MEQMNTIEDVTGPLSLGQKERCKMRFLVRTKISIVLFGIVGGLLFRCQAAGIDELVESGTLERIATGFRFTEGPVWHPDGYLLFSDIPANTIYKWVPDGTVEVFRSPSGHANGLTFDRQGRLIACEHSNRQVSRTEPDGTIVTLARDYNGNRLNSPNDAVVKSDGCIYFTDPPFGLTAEYGIPGTQELPFHGVFRLSPDGETLELLERGISRPNGLAFSPDEKVLYVANSMDSNVYAFDVQPNGLLANRRVFTHISGWPDGMKVDMRGNLYVTTNTSVVLVYDSEGMHIGNIYTPEKAENCAFGGADNRTLFITGGTSVYRIQMKVQGARLIPAPDFNGDGKIDSADMRMMVDHWLTDDPLYDIVPIAFGDGIVDVQDLVLLAEYLFHDMNDPTLVAHWALDEAEGDIAFDSAGINDAFVIGNPLWQPTSGQVNGAIELDGVDDVAIAGPVLNLANGPFSVLAWVKGGAAGQVVLSQMGVASWLGSDPLEGNLMTELKSPGRSAGPLQSQTIITDGSWHRIGLVWDGSRRILYVDSIAVAEDTQDGLEDSINGLYIGTGKAMAPGTYFSGLIDDVRIYNRVVIP
jgi:gluconolactonase